LRGFAVLLVFFVHAAGNAAFVVWGMDLQGARLDALASDAQRFVFWLYRSHHGVFLFFVLSGYLIARMWLPPEAALRAASPPAGLGALGRPGAARTKPVTYRRFAWRRTLRIYPAFLLSFAASLAFAYASGTWTPPDWPRVIGNLFFLNGAPASRVAPFNIVTWSLFYEMTFYLVFPPMLMALRNRAIVTTLGFAAPLIAVLAGVDTLALCWSLLFAGVALAHAGDAWPRIPTAAVIAAYLAITTLAAFDALPPVIAILAFAVVAAALVRLCVSEHNVVARALASVPMRMLGRVSYSFYLVHWMIVVLVARAAEGTSPAVAAAAIFVAGFALSAAAATALWWVAERPYFEYARRLPPRQ
jgi:peptidoglycan/LPS O-acetylase OafA/YrhL